MLEQAGTGQMWLLALVLIDNIYANPGTPSCNTLEKRTAEERSAKLLISTNYTLPVTLLGLENDARQTASLCSVTKTDEKECLLLGLMPEGPKAEQRGTCSICCYVSMLRLQLLLAKFKDRQIREVD